MPASSVPRPRIFNLSKKIPLFIVLSFTRASRDTCWPAFFISASDSRRREFIRRYIVLRQAEGAFRQGDPEIAVKFAVGSMVQFAMAQHIFEVKKPDITDEAVIKELAGDILGGLTESGEKRLRTNKKEKNPCESVTDSEERSASCRSSAQFSQSRFCSLSVAADRKPRTRKIRRPTRPPANALITVAVDCAENRSVEASVQVTGSFVAKETSDVAPETGGRVTHTPSTLVISSQGSGDRAARRSRREAAAGTGRRRRTTIGSGRCGNRNRGSGWGKGRSSIPTTFPKCSPLKLMPSRLCAQARLAEADAQRYASLVKTGDVSQSAYEKARTQADTAEAQAVGPTALRGHAQLRPPELSGHDLRASHAQRLQTASEMSRKAMDDTLIRAPFVGYISARPIADGQYVAVTAKIATRAAHYSHSAGTTGSGSQRTANENLRSSRNQGVRLPRTQLPGTNHGDQSRDRFRFAYLHGGSRIPQQRYRP